MYKTQIIKEIWQKFWCTNDFLLFQIFFLNFQIQTFYFYLTKCQFLILMIFWRKLLILSQKSIKYFKNFISLVKKQFNFWSFLSIVKLGYGVITHKISDVWSCPEKDHNHIGHFLSKHSNVTRRKGMGFSPHSFFCSNCIFYAPRKTKKYGTESTNYLPHF